MIRALFLLLITTSVTYAGDLRIQFVNNNQSSVVLKTGFSDVACAGGLCIVPTESNGIAVILPQSTAFFALSNPQSIEFRTRQFISSPSFNHFGHINNFNGFNHHENISFDRFGNQIIFTNGTNSSIQIINK